MKIWTFTDVQPDEDSIRTSIHGTEENALDALRAYVAANGDITYEGHRYGEEELELLTFDELTELIPPDALVAIEEHDLGPQITLAY